MAEFEFDKKAKRYRFTSGDRKGQFVSQSEVADLLSAHIDQNKDRALEIAQDLADHKITVPEWEEAIADLLKNSHIAQYQIGKPGELTFSDYGTIGNQLRFQYRKLRNFANELISGNISEGQLLFRTKLYFGKSRQSYWAGWRNLHRGDGYIWERRLLAPAIHCASCPVYAHMGWQNIGTLPLPTELCECMSNCLCSMEYSDSITRPD